MVVWIVQLDQRIMSVFATRNDANRYMIAASCGDTDLYDEYTLLEHTVETCAGDRVPYSVDVNYGGEILDCRVYPYIHMPIDAVWPRLKVGNTVWLNVECWARSDADAIATAQSERSRYIAERRWTETSPRSRQRQTKTSARH